MIEMFDTLIGSFVFLVIGIISLKIARLNIRKIKTISCTYWRSETGWALAELFIGGMAFGISLFLFAIYIAFAVFW